jgi:hypothetical protein
MNNNSLSTVEMNGLDAFSNEELTALILRGLPAVKYTINSLMMKQRDLIDKELKPQRNRVYHAINRERDYQNKRYPNGRHELMTWLCMIQVYVNDALRTETHHLEPDTRHTLRKIVALGVAALEEHGCPLRSMERSSPSKEE